LTKKTTNKIFKDTLLIVISNLVNYVSTFVIAILISRFLGVTLLGEFTFIFAFSTVLSVVTDFGFSTLLIRKINENRILALRYAAQINRFKLLASVILILLILLIIFLLSKQYFNPAFAIGIALIIPKAFQSTYESSIRALLNQRLPAMIKSLNSLVQLIIAYLLLRSNHALLEIFIMLLVTEIITAIIFKHVSDSLWKKESLPDETSKPAESFGSLARETLPFFGSNVLSFSIPRVSAILLGYLASASALGIFSAAARFAGGIGLLSGALFNSYYPVLTQKDADPLHKYLLTKKLTMYAFAAGMILSLVLYISADFLISITFRIPQSVPILRIMAFFVIPVLTHTVLQSYMLSVHKEKFILKLHLIIWVMNFIIGFILIIKMSHTGAAVTSLISEYVFLIILFVGFLKSGRNLPVDAKNI
jgi:O-antigen/teichoic acid export membrane protein